MMPRRNKVLRVAWLLLLFSPGLFSKRERVTRVSVLESGLNEVFLIRRR